MPFDGKLDIETQTPIDARAFVARGWCQHKTKDEQTGAVCAIGAIMETTVNGHIYCTSRDRIIKVLGLANNSELIWWNDAPERTQAEVLAAFDAAIAQGTFHAYPVVAHRS